MAPHSHVLTALGSCRSPTAAVDINLADFADQTAFNVVHVSMRTVLQLLANDMRCFESRDLASKMLLDIREHAKCRIVDLCMVLSCDMILCEATNSVLRCMRCTTI